MKRMALLLPLLVGFVACGGNGGDDSSSRVVAPACDLVGETDAAPATTLHVTLDEWTIRYDADSVPAGAVRFEVVNHGDVEHELAIAGPDGKLLGEIEPFAAGGTCSATFELAAGTSTLKCEIVDKDGTSHEKHGMEADLIVK